MSFVFRNDNINRCNKINYFSYKMWRSMYLISLNTVYNTSEKRIYARSSTVPNMFRGEDIVIHAGNRWKSKRVNKWMVGFKTGEFTWNRKLALYKSKKLKKKSKK